MNVFFYITSFAFFIWIFRNILFWVALWQTKEYRWDRLFAHFKETIQGRLLISSKVVVFKFLVIFLFLFAVQNEKFLPIYQIIVMGVFLYEAYVVFKEIREKTLKRPVFTIKAIIIVFLAVVSITILFFIKVVEPFLWLLLLDRILFPLVTFFVFAFAYPTEFYQDIQIVRAVNKLQKNKKVLVIGVTGSYGKSSTKEYIAQILSKKFSVLKTQGSQNTPIGIAQAIHRGLTQQTEIFVVEMGAYKRGEIAQMCEMTNPKIGVLTGISDQHLSLFGSAENLVQAKYELIAALPSNGLAIFNGDSPLVLPLYAKTKKKKVLYTSQEIKKPEKAITIVAQTVVIKKSSLSFNVILDGKPVRFETNVIGKHTIENILPGIFLADYLGMTKKEIQQAVGLLIPIPKTMVPIATKKGTMFIDDTFNASPDAIVAALEYLTIYKGKKFFILQPMIELGGKAKEIHYNLGKKLGSLCDYVFLTNSNFAQDIIEGIKEAKKTCQIKIMDTTEIAAFIASKSKKEDVVLFEGKEAGIILRKLRTFI